MTEQPGWRPENTLTLAIVVAVASVFVAAVMVVASVMRGGQAEDLAPYGLALVAAGVGAALVINAIGKKAARKNRPEWLETQAWQSGLADKLKAAQKRDDSAAKAGSADPPARP
jgi:hypothetical protein